jgi:cytoskeletal protein CcmA (bactofilin family)
MQWRVSLLLGIVLIASAFNRDGNHPSPKKANHEGITFIVEPGRTILVKGDFLIESDAVIDIRGTLLVEGEMLVNKGLSLVIRGQGKLLVKGDLKNQSARLKSITVLDNGQLSIDGTLDTNENIEIITEGMGLIKASKIVVRDNASLGGTRNLEVSNCNCEQVSKKSEPNICQLLVLAKT